MYDKDDNKFIAAVLKVLGIAVEYVLPAAAAFTLMALLLFGIYHTITCSRSSAEDMTSTEATDQGSIDSDFVDEPLFSEENSESSVEGETGFESEESDDTLVSIEPTSLAYIVIDSVNIKELEVELEYCKAQLALVQTALSNVSALGYPDTCELILALQEDFENYSSYISYYEEKIKELKELTYQEQYAEYPAATYIWYFMKERGWSDIVCAGIMGNIMQEVGGRTLDINYLHSNNYYGICCWKKEYHPEVVDKDLEGQCIYLVETLVSCMNNSGYLYEDNYTYEDFLAAETIEEAANAFMVVYERPGHTESPKRIENAEKAYDYFVSTIETD